MGLNDELDTQPEARSCPSVHLESLKSLDEKIRCLIVEAENELRWGNAGGDGNTDVQDTKTISDNRRNEKRRTAKPIFNFLFYSEYSNSIIGSIALFGSILIMLATVIWFHVYVSSPAGAGCWAGVDPTERQHRNNEVSNMTVSTEKYANLTYHSTCNNSEATSPFNLYYNLWAMITVIVCTLCLSTIHEVEHDVFHNIYFKKKKTWSTTQHVIPSTVSSTENSSSILDGVLGWLFYHCPDPRHVAFWLIHLTKLHASPWWRWRVHMRHHNVSGTKLDIEERLLGLGLPLFIPITTRPTTIRVPVPGALLPWRNTKRCCSSRSLSPKTNASSRFFEIIELCTLPPLCCLNLQKVALWISPITYLSIIPSILKDNPTFRWWTPMLESKWPFGFVLLGSLYLIFTTGLVLEQASVLESMLSLHDTLIAASRSSTDNGNRGNYEDATLLSALWPSYIIKCLAMTIHPSVAIPILRTAFYCCFVASHLRHFCLTTITTHCHYYSAGGNGREITLPNSSFQLYSADETSVSTSALARAATAIADENEKRFYPNRSNAMELLPGVVHQQVQILDHFFLLPAQLFCWNFGATHWIHHFIVNHPFWLRSLIARRVNRKVFALREQPKHQKQTNIKMSSLRKTRKQGESIAEEKEGVSHNLFTTDISSAETRMAVRHNDVTTFFHSNHRLRRVEIIV